MNLPDPINSGASPTDQENNAVSFSDANDPPIVRQLEAARQRLLDLTMRNRLLNYRTRKAASIRIVDEIPREIYDILVIQEKKMDFVPRKEDEPPSNEGTLFNAWENGQLASTVSTEDEDPILWQSPALEDGVADRHVDRSLQTTLTSEQLQKRLFYVSKQAQSVLEEQGYNIHYLAMGFVEWKESESADQMRKAPLILIPVELKRTRVGKAYKLSWTGEDILTNISLKEKLGEQGIDLKCFTQSETTSPSE